MKKLVFAVIAAFLVNLSFTSCSSSPEDQLIGCMEEMLSVLKSTHFESAKDLKAFKEKMEGITEKANKAEDALKKKEKDMSKDEAKKYEEEMENKYGEKLEKIKKDINSETERLMNEASEADISMSDLYEIFNNL